MAAGRTWLAVAVGLVAAAVSPVAAAPICAPRNEAAVADTVRAMYAALTRDDDAGLRAVLADNFYAFDGGRRFDGLALAKLVKAAHAGGKIYRWSVARPDVTIDCATARITYVNEGSAGDTAGVQPRTWLESAALRLVDGRWRIEFLHSSPAAAAP